MNTKEILLRALSRMDRARDILTDGKPTPVCNWGLLATDDLRWELAKQNDDPCPPVCALVSAQTNDSE